jgi:hypothetical protein
MTTGIMNMKNNNRDRNPKRKRVEKRRRVEEIMFCWEEDAQGKVGVVV